MTAGDIDGSGDLSLIVGSPFASVNSSSSDYVITVSVVHILLIYFLLLKQTGSVAVFRSSASRVPANMSVTDADFLLNGDASFGYFGTSLAVQTIAGTPTQFGDATALIIIGAPTYLTVNGSVGRLYFYAVSGSTITLAATISGTSDKAKFCNAIALGQIEPGDFVLAVSSPSYGNPYLFDTEYIMGGRVDVFALASIPLGDSVVNELSPISTIKVGICFLDLIWMLSF